MKEIRYLALALLLTTANLANAAEDNIGIAKQAIVEFVEAVIAGPERLAPMLAPEYQIMRSSGVGYDRDDYLNKGIGTISIKPSFSIDKIHVTMEDNIMVVRYMLDIEETIDGSPVTKRSPRLTVFRMIDEKWKIVSHSNFAQVQ